jgi:hypothetical protein
MRRRRPVAARDSSAARASVTLDGVTRSRRDRNSERQARSVRAGRGGRALRLDHDKRPADPHVDDAVLLHALEAAVDLGVVAGCPWPWEPQRK